MSTHLTQISGSPVGLQPSTDDGKTFSVYCNEFEALRMFYYYRNHLDIICLKDVSYKNMGPDKTHFFQVMIEVDN